MRSGCYTVMNVIAKFPNAEKDQHPKAFRLLNDVFSKNPGLAEVAEKHDYTTGCLKSNYNIQAKNYEKFSRVCRCNSDQVFKYLSREERAKFYKKSLLR